MTGEIAGCGAPLTPTLRGAYEIVTRSGEDPLPTQLGIAHDFNNILMVIRGNVELVMHDLSRPAAALPSLEAIRTAGNRASRLVRQILAFAGPQTAELAPVKMPTVVDEGGGADAKLFT